MSCANAFVGPAARIQIRCVKARPSLPSQEAAGSAPRCGWSLGDATGVSAPQRRLIPCVSLANGDHVARSVRQRLLVRLTFAGANKADRADAVGSVNLPVDATGA